MFDGAKANAIIIFRLFIKVALYKKFGSCWKFDKGLSFTIDFNKKKMTLYYIILIFLHNL